MRTVTFYSFKGGVGRTMALINSAASLMQRGRRVLLVDFDLEAPGIQTYAPFADHSQQKGLVDYITDFMRDSEAPDVSEYLREYRFNGYPVWLMPAGLRDAHYPNRLNSIEWLRLYNDHNGYLMFEDLKQQWKAMKFDYVLIDSRTGHTDVAGICTRQLPEAVVLMFLPNDQNIAGLQDIVKDIRNERETARKKNIFLHFCPSNVPDLDDEELILQRHLDDAKEKLGYDSVASIVHHYNSLALLDQKIFVEARPRTRLADEYRKLVDAIVAENVEDKDGALSKLDKIRTSLRLAGDGELSDIEETLGEIYKHHSDNGEIAWSLSLVYEMLSNVDAQREMLDIAIRHQVNEARARTKRAQILLRNPKSEMGRDDLRQVLASKDASTPDLIASIERLQEIDPDWISTLQSSEVMDRLKGAELERISITLMTSEAGAAFAADVLEKRAPTHSNKMNLVLSLIGSGKYQKALHVLGSRDSMLVADSIADVFNYACAEWGLRGAAQKDMFSRAIELANDVKYSISFEDPNFVQCLSMANFVCGNYTASFELLARAHKALENLPPRLVFSCWHYLYLKKGDLRADLIEMEAGMRAGRLVPAFIRQPSLIEH